VLKTGFECAAHKGLHLNVDLYPLRIVDDSGAGVAVGQCGEVVMSNLVNRATVLLNYRLGDIAALAPEACPCGRTLPLMTYLQGRTDDIVELPTGERFHPAVFRAAFNGEDAVWQYQVVHQSDLHVAVAVVTDEHANRANIQARLAARFARIFGDSVTVSIEFPPSIDRSSAGKLRAVVDGRRDSGSR
jgi:phenylacetate-CoA ligase